MNAILIAIFTLSAFSLGYRFYARYLAREIFGSEGPEAEGIALPAHELRDDVDYVPTNKHVLFGHHFTSIAGAGPIVGPAVAVIWGWLPAVLWIAFGAVFIGAVHDFGCLVVSARSKGRSMAEITGQEIGARAQWLFLALILFLTWIVLAVFAFVIASLFVDYPASVLPINFEILVAVVLGYGVTKRGWPLLWPSIIALVALYAMVFVGVQVPVVSHELFMDGPKVQALRDIEAKHPNATAAGVDFCKPKIVARFLKKNQDLDADGSLQSAVMAGRSQAVKMWIVLLLVYSFIACGLPVWLLLQPRDYINSHQLFVGLTALYLGLLLLRPAIVAPAFDPHPPGAPPWFPFIFVTIACGAISGFHGLVSSGTTSKQLDNMADARPIGYGSMLGEASLGLIVVLACIAGFKTEHAWADHYRSWGAAGSLDSKLDAFLSGGAWFLESFALPPEIGMVFIAVIVISFAATTLDSAARVQRFVLSEIGDRIGKSGQVLKNVWVGSLIACATPLLLLEAKTAEGKPLWTEIWPIFGAANQLLGALSLIVLTVWIYHRKKKVWATLIPFGFIGAMTAYAFCIKLAEFWGKAVETNFEKGKLILATTALLFLFGLAILCEAMLALRQAWKASQTTTEPKI